MASLEEKGGVLDCNAILDARDRGDIVIEPFVEMNLSGSSLDVTLGSHYFLEQTLEERQTIVETLGLDRDWKVRMPFDKHEALITWGNPQAATDHIVIPPGMTILAHTNEFVGDRGGFCTTMMKSRSSLGRSLAEACKCAGWGDPHFHNRWTMEITNTSQHTALSLPVGKRIAQIVFLPLQKGSVREETESKRLYRGKYQPSNLEEKPPNYHDLLKVWSPMQMLPRLHEDKDQFQEPSL